MKSLIRIGILALVVTVGVTGTILTAAGFGAIAAAGEVDLAVDLNAPSHIAAGTTFDVNIAYANVGTEKAPDAWVTAWLPPGTEFLTATDPFGLPLPPDIVASNTLTWTVGPLAANTGRGHILVALQSAESLTEGEWLTTTAVIAATEVESNTLNNTATVTSVVCDMAGSAKQAQNRRVTPGGLVSYTIHVSLARRFGEGVNGRWVLLTDTLPFSHQVRFLGWTGTLTGPQIDGQMLSWQGRVRIGQPLTLQYRVGVEGSVAPGTVLTNVAMLSWGEGHMRLGPVTTVVTLPQDALALGPLEGGHLYHPHGVRLDVPPGAVTDTTLFRLGPLFTDTFPITPPGNLLFAHRAFEMTASRFGNTVRDFSRPLTITLHYTDKDIEGLQRETLRLWTRTGPSESWSRMGEPVRTMSGSARIPTLVFTTSHFSQFALFAKSAYRSYLPVAIR
jgi:hypothetical protein